MALGRRGPREQALFIATEELPSSPGHPFYRKLNELLAEAQFDRRVEELCRPHYADRLGRPSIAPGVYFRMLFVGYFEGIDSQRGIAWRCSDSRSLQEFLGLGMTQETPDHSSLTDIRQRLPSTVHEEVFRLLLEIARQKGVLRGGKTLGVDSTMLEANAAMKSIVRRDTGASWTKYLTRLAKQAGIKNPTAEDLRRMDRQRPGKKVSNADWKSPSDPDSRIARMKDGRTHLAYKAEHAVDLDSEVIVAAAIHPADRSDAQTLPDTLVRAQTNLLMSGSEERVEEAVADKGYHAAETLRKCQLMGVRTYIGERKSKHLRRWTNKVEGLKEAVYAARRRAAGRRSPRLQRLRSERVERTFAHVCETGGARRTWLRGEESVSKRYLIQVAAHNLAIVMRKLFGFGTPRQLAALGSAFVGRLLGLLHAMLHLAVRLVIRLAKRRSNSRPTIPEVESSRRHGKRAFPTGC
jgi:transposase